MNIEWVELAREGWDTVGMKKNKKISKPSRGNAKPDVSQVAFRVVQIATGQAEPDRKPDKNVKK